MSVDPERGILYAPSTSPSPDYWGGLRSDLLPGIDAVVALNVRTGALIWQFQTVHHNLFDYDLPAQPTLVDVARNGQAIPAVAQPTKTGFLWVLNRDTGSRCFRRRARRGAVRRARASSSPTQPEPLMPPPLALQSVSDADVWASRRSTVTPVFAASTGCATTVFSHRRACRAALLFPISAAGRTGAAWAMIRDSHVAILNAMNSPVCAAVPAAEYAALKRAGGPTRWRRCRRAVRDERGLVLSPLGSPARGPLGARLPPWIWIPGEIRWQHPFGTQPTGIPGLNAPASWARRSWRPAGDRQRPCFIGPRRTGCSTR